MRIAGKVCFAEDETLLERCLELRPELPEAVPDPKLLKKDALWKLGISGDLPILAANLTEEVHKRAAMRLLRQHALLRALGLRCDLVFCTGDGGDYRQPAARFVTSVLRRMDREDTLARSGGVHLVSDAETVRCCAAVWTDRDLPEREPAELSPAAPDRRDLSGGRIRHSPSTDGSFRLQCDHALPRRAWSMPLTNARFGCTAADSGCGDLWLGNARLRRITPWRNDPWAVDGPETMEILTEDGMRSLFCSHETAGRFTCRPGYAQWESGDVRATVFVPFEADARVLLLETKTPVTIRWRVDLLLAESVRDECAVITEAGDGSLKAANPRAAEPFSVTARCSAGFERFTCSRQSAALGRLDGFTGVGTPACFCAEFRLEDRAVLLLGDENTQPLLDWDAAVQALKRTLAVWMRFTGRLRCETAEAAFGQYLSGWGAYQALACRLFARTSLYQSGGAFGFRDQLQDAVNLLLWSKKPARAQILRCCAHQFPEGDVCHWWHEKAGVRTRISDDLLWLPWAVVEYVEKTGDLAVLTETAPYLESEPLGDRERERYAPLCIGSQSGTVLEHSIRAIQCVLRRGTGAHGLLKTGSGDWNDGFDRVGGESVWLSWFFSHTAHRMGALLDRLAMPGGEAMHRAAEQIGAAAEAGWDGAWYRRGYFEDGTPLGSSESDACQIDAIAQSFAAFCPEADADHVRQALTSALERLFDLEHSLVKLFDPPFTAARPDPGYVRSYGPGFRENGGQYTHGAVWLALALLKTGRTDEGWQVLRALLPARHPEEVYEAEPFVLSADVYAGDHPERAGWSWYTGAAGWYLRTAAEALFGLTAENGEVTLHPNLPPECLPCSLRWRDGAGGKHRIEYTAEGVTVDGEACDGGVVGPL